MFAGVAQLAEQLICNQQVAGSSPITSSIALLHGGIPEWPKGADCKSAVADFDGSNPSPSTIIEYADMAELADAYGSGPYESNLMKVQVLLSAPCRNEYPSFRFFISSPCPQLRFHFPPSISYIIYYQCAIALLLSRYLPFRTILHRFPNLFIVSLFLFVLLSFHTLF